MTDLEIQDMREQFAFQILALWKKVQELEKKVI